MISADRKFLAYLDEMNIITILLPLSYHNGLSSAFYLTADALKIPLEILKSLEIEHNHKYICRFEGDFSFGKQYWIVDQHGEKTDLQIGAVIRTNSFDEKFYYDGQDLGVTFHTNQTRFKLWAPTATGVKLKYRPAAGQYSEIIKMRREDCGIWSVSTTQDVEAYRYSFLVQVNHEWHEVIDPYAKAVTANGEQGVIVKLEKTSRPRPDVPPIEHPVDAIIYETHIRDFSIHPNSGIRNKGLYLGAGEWNTKGKDGEPTGLSYLKELGITHIEFLPFHDFAGVDELHPTKDYNWGYNPLHFNAPEGSYATDPENPYSRITELKELIDQIHRIGLRVMMDVVYNHVYIREKSSFEKVVPGYYFRHNEVGLPSNGTGVGNDIASERKMVRKYIVDSVRYWMEEYHIDGFRFDLMGILDVETMTEVKKTCESIKEGTLIIGEGWNLNTPLPMDQKATIGNQAKMPDIAQFNDKFRDSIKGSTFNLFDKGFALGNDHHLDAAIEVITGSIGLTKRGTRLFNEPYQSVNYVECHDNHTLWDKLQACFPDVDEETRMKYHRLATGIVLLSQGIPFLHSGQEFFRTKFGEGNSYRSTDLVNQLDWDRKSQFKENVEYIKGLIQIRKTFSCFRMRTSKEIHSQIHLLSFPAPVVGFLFKKNHKEVIIIINPSTIKQIIHLPDGEWSVLVNQKNAGISSKAVLQEGENTMDPISLNVLLKK
ncbi:type I pullulanase [Neobacillus sp. MM2021_6]|uniref:type I pullulanase n=1 Tax=Bacillaceae TaxID=186817 RepID=UPI0014083A16|nr:MULTISPECIES: type I pullulanase [Bacillaceae]MBO0960334.1 type I pullulanase [Neobacillus sp. MM2021_6]NHC17444.1 type I pullulanase [Bacillus sp. MM2020_4]